MSIKTVYAGIKEQARKKPESADINPDEYETLELEANGLIPYY